MFLKKYYPDVDTAFEMASNENLDQIAPSLGEKGQLIYDLFITPKLDRKIAGITDKDIAYSCNHTEATKKAKHVLVPYSCPQRALGGTRLMLEPIGNQINMRNSQKKQYSQTFTINHLSLTISYAPFIISSS